MLTIRPSVALSSRYFGEAVQIGPPDAMTTIEGVFDDAHMDVTNQDRSHSSQAITLTVHSSDVVGLDTDTWWVVVRGKTFEIQDPRPDGDGYITLHLTLRDRYASLS